MRNKSAKIRVLIYPGASDAAKAETKKRYQTLFIGSDLTFEEMDISDFLVNKDMLWNW
ncbi:MAG: hypothetical protein LBR16_06130 [Treponema sp.]|nr:hypothetical protein [Treponema sp.]